MSGTTASGVSTGTETAEVTQVDAVQAEASESAESGVTPAAELLAAGAILPPDTADAGERAVPLTARVYQHPGLSDRVVVRLVPAELGVAEDAAAGFLGLEPAAEPAVVGLGLRQSLGFPEWVLVNYPQDGQHALGVVPELERAARQAKTKPKAALDAYLELAKRLAVAVPHFLPTFYEQAGRVFLSVENSVYAAQMFTKARAAEAEHGLRIDEERLDAVFLEFALAGALPVKVLAAYGRELAVRLPGEEALRRFTRLCVRRTAGGLVPSAQMTTELRKLAKAAGAKPDVVEQEFVAELLTLPATLRAAVGWWKAHRASLVALALRESAVRRTLLDVMPADGDPELDELWLDVLIESGATETLHDPSADPQLRPSDGTAGWLRRFQKTREGIGWWRGARRLPQLYALVERCLDRLREELSVPDAAPLDPPDDIDLLDLLLSLGLPVADPDDNATLNLERWSEGEGHRNLVALAADARFHPAFDRGADRFRDSEDGKRAISTLASSPGGSPMLATWVRAIAERFAAVGLPQLPDAIERLSWLPGEALALAEPQVRAAATTNLAPVLSRTLRAGLFDELCWPAWEQAAAELIPAKDIDDLVIADAWPYLIVAGPAQVRVIGAEGVVLTHDLRIPAKDNYGDPDFHYVDGELLVYWRSRGAGDREYRGYWHGSAGKVQAIEAKSGHGTRVGWYRSLNSTVQLPGGGRAVGGGVLHRGDTVVPEAGYVLSDGNSYWVLTRDESDEDRYGWFEYDPSTNQRGRRSYPAYFNDALRDAPSGSTFRAGTIRPLGEGLHGWAVVTLPDGSMHARDLAGAEVTVPKDSALPVRALVIPGADGSRPPALVRDSYEVAIIDADGVTTAEARTDRAPGDFGCGSPLLPPTSYWHCMQPRDPAGSALLRRIDDDQAALLLKAGTGQRHVTQVHDVLPDLLGELLPEVTDRNLLAGITGVVRFAARQQATLDQVAERLDGALAGGSRRDDGPLGPDDHVLFEPMRSLGAGWLGWNHGKAGDGTFRQLRLIGEALRLAPRVDAKISVHLDGPHLPASADSWWLALLDGCSALAIRAASPITDPEVGAALSEVLRVFDEAGLAAPQQQNPWRRFTVFLPDRLVNDPDGNRRRGSWHGLLPTPGGGLLAVIGAAWGNNGIDFTAIHHDPTGRHQIPAPYKPRDAQAVGEQREAGWLAAFRAELAQRGPAPWFPAAAEQFAQLTGTTPTEARLIMAGLPGVEASERNNLSAETRAVLGSKAAEITMARDQLRRVDAQARRAVVAALLPADPARLWSEGPDAVAAAEVWNRRVGKRVAVPEALLAEATRAVRTTWAPAQSLPALLDPAAAPELSRDLAWKVRGDRVEAAEKDAVGFTTQKLVGAAALLAWLTHRLPAGDPIRTGLPVALNALSDRIAYPELMLRLGRYVSLPEFRKSAGAPTEVTKTYERYGAVILPTHDDRPMPAVQVSMLDAAGSDPYLTVLRGETQTPFPVEVALALVRDPRFAALVADPGDPVAGQRDKDGTWSPQDPTRSVPDLVAEAAQRFDLGADAAAVYLMLLAMPDPTDRNVARWTGWKPARLTAARTELAATDLVVQATRSRAGRSLFLPGGWTVPRTPHLPLEQWKLPFFGVFTTENWPVLGVVVPTEPAGQLYRRAWQRVQEGDGPRFEELQVPRARTRRR